MSEMKLLLENWRKFINETRNQDFINEFIPLLKQWRDLQDEYGYIKTNRYDPEGNPYDPEGAGQIIDPSELPDHGKLKWYADKVPEGPGPRRAHNIQSFREIEIERKLLQLFQKYADQSFFQNQVTLAHDLNYSAAASSIFGNTLDMKFPDSKETREGYLSQERQRHKDVMSCHGYVNGKLPASGYGMILKGHVVFASRSDLASQTLRAADQTVRDVYKHSGLPKRTGPGRVHGKDSTLSFRQRIHQRKRERAIAAGLDPEPELSQEDLNNMINYVVLSADDISGGYIEEALVANWTIEGWYCHFREGRPWPEDYWKKAYEIGIDKPVYLVSVSGENLGVINLQDYFEKD